MLTSEQIQECMKFDEQYGGRADCRHESLIPRSPHRAQPQFPTGAVFSADRIYRYTLWRQWESGSGYANFIGLNPSTADETKDDPTIRKCVKFAKAWGYRALCMTNLFAYRATEPRKMKGYPQPIGPENDRWLVGSAKDAEIVVAAWGRDGQFSGRDLEVEKILDDLRCLGMNANGTPKHPLYLRDTAVPETYNYKEPF